MWREISQYLYSLFPNEAVIYLGASLYLGKKLLHQRCCPSFSHVCSLFLLPFLFCPKTWNIITLYRKMYTIQFIIGYYLAFSLLIVHSSWWDRLYWSCFFLIYLLLRSTDSFSLSGQEIWYLLFIRTLGKTKF